MAGDQLSSVDLARILDNAGLVYQGLSRAELGTAVASLRSEQVPSANPQDELDWNSQDKSPPNTGTHKVSTCNTAMLSRGVNKPLRISWRRSYS